MSSYLKDIQFNKVIPKAHVLSHKQALLTLAQNAAQDLNISDINLHKRLCEVDANTNSALGDNVVLLHLKMRRIHVPFTMLMTLQSPVVCDTPDDQPVQIYCLQASPAADMAVHLRRLSRISRLLKGAAVRKSLMETYDEDIMKSLLQDPEGWLLAA